MSKRAHPRDAWRPPRPKAEIAKAVAAAVVIVGATAGIVYLWPTSSSAKSPVTVQTSTPATTNAPAPSAPPTTTAPPTTKAGATP